MVEIRFSNAAEADLTDIDTFSVAHFGVDAAESYMRGFEKAFARLLAFPQAGSSVEAYVSGLRCLVYRSHRIFYRMNDDDVLVLRVLHHAQDAGRHLSE